MRTTIKDVAREAGVSPATVSLVLNNSSLPISSETKNRVLQAANRLNYRPNMLAVSLATKRSSSIGLILPDVGNPFFSSISKHIQQAAMKNNYAVVACSTDDDCTSTCNYLRFFSDRGVDGIILTQSDFQSEEETATLLSVIEDIQIPIVLIDRVYETSPLPAVLVDQEKAGYLATQDLLEAGHKRIGCVTGPLGIYGTRKRLEGYQKALSEYDLQYDPSLIFEGKYDIQTGIASVPYLLGKKVTGVFCFADYIATGLYQGIRNLGRKIPEDLSVVSIDDTILAEAVQPSLTSVAQPIEAIAAAAVETLIQIINSGGKSSPKIQTLEPALKVRASVKNIT